jgi:altronate dehydratase large subunit
MKNSEIEWKGFLRKDGSMGIRNIILVVFTVECAQHVAQRIIAGEKDCHLIGFPGCKDNEYATRLLISLSQHPNVGAALFVGLGCEYTQPDRLCEMVKKSGRPSYWFLIQEEGGTEKSIRKGKEIVEKMRKEINKTTSKISMGFEDLVIGCACGGSDATSGLAGNPLAGIFIDRLVDSGGRAVFEEIVELVGLLPLLQDRAATADTREELTALYHKMELYCKNVRHYSIAPGNYAGGLSTIEEKSLGALAKSGSRPIKGVIKVSEKPPEPGLWLMDTVPDDYYMQFGYTDPNDSEGLMNLLSSGAQIILFVTGRGSVIGCPISPVIKITGNSYTFQIMEGDMDINAGKILSGESNFKEVVEELQNFVVRVCKGEKTKSEILGHREFYIPYKYQALNRQNGQCLVLGTIGEVT